MHELEQNQIDINVAVRTIGNLPSLLLPKDLEYTKNELKLVRAYKFFFQGQQVWLHNLVLKQALNPAAIETDWKHFQGHAAINAALLDLISGLHPRVPAFQEACPEKEAPSIIWLTAIAIDTSYILKESGLTLDPDAVEDFLGYPVLLGKTDYCKLSLALLDSCDQSITSTAPKKPSKKEKAQTVYNWKDDPITYLCKVAAWQAKWNPDFDKQYWQPYSKTRRYWIRKIRDNKILQAACLLPNGELFVTGQRKKIPKSIRPSSGFG